MIVKLSESSLLGTLRKPRTKGYFTKYHKNRVKSNAQVGRVLCVDGEGIDNNPQKYIYIAASNLDASIIHEKFNEEGLSTEECFWFLANLPRNHLKVAFSFDYDINMMLKDLNIFQLLLLHEKGRVYWNGWRIQWTPHKSFSISRKGSKKHPRISCTVWDIFGYFQTSFVKTIWKWQVGTDEELRLISRMKESRSEFTFAQIAEISFYCRLECKLGAQVFHKLLQRTKEVGLTLRRYDGAGSVAAAMLRKHDVQSYMHQKLRLPDEVICAGYYGGRFDLSTFGECGNAIQFDINSAYPYQALSLPCLSCGAWKYTSNYDFNAPWACWLVEWDIDESHLWSPFPYRNKGHIYYLRNGSGGYWANEVREAIRNYPTSVRVRSGYVYEVNCVHQPFSFIAGYFQRRKQLKEQGDLAEIVLKLGMNSIYGKLAQNAGRNIPKTQCLIWAGIITSNTRAMLLTSLRYDPNALLLATDAVISKNELPLPIGAGLGQWERTYLQNLFIITNGVYQARGTKEDKHATRGVSLKDLYDPDNHVDHWAAIRKLASQSSRFTYEATSRRFVGLGKALATNPALLQWRSWQVEPHKINYGKFDHKEFRDGRLYPGANPWGQLISQPYEPANYRQDSSPLVGDAPELMLDGLLPGLLSSEGEG